MKLLLPNLDCITSQLTFYSYRFIPASRPSIVHSLKGIFVAGVLLMAMSQAGILNKAKK